MEEEWWGEGGAGSFPDQWLLVKAGLNPVCKLRKHITEIIIKETLRHNHMVSAVKGSAKENFRTKRPRQQKVNRNF